MFIVADLVSLINHETPGRQIKQSNRLSLPHQDDCNTRMDIIERTAKHRTITDSHNGSNNKQKSTTKEPGEFDVIKKTKKHMLLNLTISLYIE